VNDVQEIDKKSLSTTSKQNGERNFNIKKIKLLKKKVCSVYKM
jgi:hypothetical protein